MRSISESTAVARGFGHAAFEAEETGGGKGGEKGAAVHTALRSSLTSPSGRRRGCIIYTDGFLVAKPRES